MGIFAMFMAMVILFVDWMLSFVVGYENGRMQSVFVLLVGVVVGAAVYLFLAYRSRLLEVLLGSRFRFLSRKQKKAVE